MVSYLLAFYLPFGFRFFLPFQERRYIHIDALDPFLFLLFKFIGFGDVKVGVEWLLTGTQGGLRPSLLIICFGTRDYFLDKQFTDLHRGKFIRSLLVGNLESTVKTFVANWWEYGVDCYVEMKEYWLGRSSLIENNNSLFEWINLILSIWIYKLILLYIKDPINHILVRKIIRLIPIGSFKIR